MIVVKNTFLSKEIWQPSNVHTAFFLSMAVWWIDRRSSDVKAYRNFLVSPGEDEVKRHKRLI